MKPRRWGFPRSRIPGVPFAMKIPFAPRTNTAWPWCSRVFAISDIKPTVAIIGIGLIGGSLGQALRKSKRYRVLGIARRPSTLRDAKHLGVMDAGSTNLADVYQADIVVMATPVDSIVPLIRQIRPFLKS